MKLMQHDEALHGVGATALVTLAGVEDFGVKLATSICVALVSTLLSALVKRMLAKKLEK